MAGMKASLKNRVLAWVDVLYYLIRYGFDLGRAEAEMEKDQQEEIRKAKELLNDRRPD